MSRILPFETVYNFRDFGQYPGHDGQVLARGKLFRSANLHNMEGADSARFDALNIGAIIDMRYAPERQKQPNRLPPNHQAVTLPYIAGKEKEAMNVAPHEAFMEHDLRCADDAHRYMMNSYRQRPLDVGFQNLARKSLQHMARTGEGVLVHCAAGKDRTGTLVALIHHILGVPKDLIFEDYMLTMTAIDMTTLLDRASVQLSKKYGRNYNPDMLQPLFGVSEDYLQQSFNTMEDMDSYIETALGITDAEKAAIAAHYFDN